MADQRYETMNPAYTPRSNRRWALIVALAFALGVGLGGYFWSRNQNPKPEEKVAIGEHADEHGAARKAELSPEALKAAKIETAVVGWQAANETLRATGTV